MRVPRVADVDQLPIRLETDLPIGNGFNRPQIVAAPLAGKQALELAGGALDQVFCVLADMGKCVIESRVRMEGLSEADAGNCRQ